MSEVRDTARYNCNKSIFKQIEAPSRITQKAWIEDDLTATSEGTIALINRANKSIDIVEYFDSKFVLTYVPSSTGWNYKTYCPFHKNGNERTPSFFINQNDNRCFCQACGFSGGIVEFIQKYYKRGHIETAEHIINCISGKISIEEDVVIDKIKSRKEIEKLALYIADLHRDFIQKYIDDEEALIYIEKIMKSFDLLFIYNTTNLGDHIEEIKTYIKLHINKFKEG